MWDSALARAPYRFPQSARKRAGPQLISINALNCPRSSQLRASLLDLRIRFRHQESRGIERRVVGVLGIAYEFLPPWVRAKFFPAGQMRGEIRTAGEVAKMRKIGTGESLAEEDGRHPEVPHQLG